MHKESQIAVPQTRLRWLRIVLPVAYLCGMLLSFRLWFGLGRTFPRTPILQAIPPSVLSLDFIVTILLVGTLVLTAIFHRFYVYPAMSVVLTVLLVVLDQMRLQPWVYQYAIMLALLAIAPRGLSNQRMPGAVCAANQLVIASLYFWSGLQKLNWSFGHEVVPTLFESVGIRLDQSYESVMAVAIALCEMLIGIGLLLRKTRYAAVIFAAILHLVLLATLIISRRNIVVWPWNLAMLLMVVILFWRTDESPLQYLVPLRARREDYLPKVTVLIVGLLPVLSLIGWWDLYLSGALYSGNNPVGVMRISESARDRFPPTVAQLVFQSSRGELILPFYEWSLAELNVPPYPEIRVYRQVARQLCPLETNQQVNGLIVRERPARSDGSYKVTLTTCADLIGTTTTGPQRSMLQR